MFNTKSNLQKSVIEGFNEELNHINSSSFQLGEYIYMGMATVNNRLICLSVAYKIDYALQKLLEAVGEINAASDKSIVTPTKINKVKVGELEKEKSFYL